MDFSPYLQLSPTTLEESRYYFEGSHRAAHESVQGADVPPGVYRVVDGRLYQIMCGRASIGGVIPISCRVE